MKRVFLIDWDAASASDRGAGLKDAGWKVDVESVDGALAWKRMRETPPDVVAIDLSRLPSHGRETARAIQSAKELREIPIVFFDGTDEARSKALGVVPGAHHTTGDELVHVLARVTMRAAR